MRLFAFSLATCAATSICLMALFVYALHIPTRTAHLLEGPPSLTVPSDAANPRASWPERWAATNLRTIK
jgi:hypothetical protein